MSENRTEKATPKRRQKTRSEGKIPRSREMSSALGLIAVICFLRWSRLGWVEQWHDLFARLLKEATETDLQASGTVLSWTGITAFKWLGPACAMGFGISLVTQLMQGGFVFAPAALAPKGTRLNPATNVKQIFSASGLSRTLKSLVPLGAILYLTFIVIASQWSSIIHSSAAGISALPGLMFGRSFEVAWKAAFVFALWSVADYALTRWKFESDLKMTKQEVRDESKEGEGNPAVKGRMRRLQRQMRKRRMLQDVETATVVITNPTHFAVALRYDMETMGAPIVVAKGRDLIAQQIKQIAHWNGIPMVENRPLAQTLYRVVDVGSVIPSKLFTAVAEILAFVYRAQAQAAQRQRGMAQ